MTKYIMLLSIVLFLLCCGKKNDTLNKTADTDILTKEEMKSVLVDVMLVEGATGYAEANRQDVLYAANRYYSYVFTKHKITNEQFMKSFTYYASEVKTMEKIMNEVVEDISQRQSKVRNE